MDRHASRQMRAIDMKVWVAMNQTVGQEERCSINTDNRCNTDTYKRCTMDTDRCTMDTDKTVSKEGGVARILIRGVVLIDLLIELLSPQ